MKKLFNILVFALTTLCVGAFFGADSPGEFFLAGTAVGAMAMLTPDMKGVLYMAIPLTQARALFTQSTIAVYKERPSVMSFLRSFFSTTTSKTKYVSIEVQRGTEKIAVDVELNSKGNRNKLSKSTEKIFQPPYYHEYFTVNDNDLYDVAIGSQNPADMVNLAQQTADALMELQKKIERALEKQCADVLETGIITLAAGSGTIDFKRKAGSLVDNSGSPWSGSNNPYSQIQTGCQWIRDNGKAQGVVYNMICGSTALRDLLSNSFVTARADIRSYTLDQVNAPQRDAAGGSFHGEISCGPFRVRIWSYNESYESSTGTLTPYLNAKKVILLPENPNFKLAYAQVRQLLKDGQAPAPAGEYLIQEFMDERETAHEMHIKSACVAVPVGVDQIYTMQVCA